MRLPPEVACQLHTDIHAGQDNSLDSQLAFLYNSIQDVRLDLLLQDEPQPMPFVSDGSAEFLSWKGVNVLGKGLN
jgi:hypothetical protein